jgi:hypothetical protein
VYLLQQSGGSLGPGLDEGEGVLVASKSKSAGIALGRSVWAGLIVLIAGCSAPVLRTPAFVDAPAYDSPRCAEVRELDRASVHYWLPASCFKAVAR